MIRAFKELQYKLKENKEKTLDKNLEKTVDKLIQR